MPANAGSWLVFRSKSKDLEKSDPFLFLGFLTRKRLLMHLWQVFVLSTERHNEHSRNLNIIKTIIHLWLICSPVAVQTKWATRIRCNDLCQNVM